MPKLVFSIGCDKAIIDRETNQISLISVLENINVKVPKEGLPEDAKSPYPWSLVAFWSAEPEDIDRIFEQRVQIIQPDGVALGDATVKFSFVEPSHKVITSGVGLPVSQPGQCSLRLSLREQGLDSEWKVISEFPITILHATEGQPEQE